jgi:nitroreductase
MTGSALARERRYVRRGIRAYAKSSTTGGDLFLLRRNVHRIEKGLTMQPVRDQFATDYIRQTVKAFRGCVASRTLTPEHPEFNWMYSVLTCYFDVTATSNHKTIAQCRADFEDVIATIDPGDADSGPQIPDLSTPPVKVDDLTALAVKRRSVRWFTPERVERELVDRAVRIAAESPTACNRQPYRFDIFDDPVSTAKVAAIPMGTDGYEHQIPGLIVIVGDMSAFFHTRDRHLIYVDGCLAAMGLIYGLESQGVNTCCINWPDLPDKEAQMAKLLDLKPYQRVIMLVAYGYADPDALAPFSAKRLVDDVRRFRTLT